MTSLAMISCSEGDRGFVPLPEEAEPEVTEELFITASAVKGPLVNADISIYKFELHEGLFADFNGALKAWFELLESNDVTIDESDEGYSLGSVSEQDIVDDLNLKIAQFGYVTELKKLKRNLNKETNFNDAKQLVEADSDTM